MESFDIMLPIIFPQLKGILPLSSTLVVIDGDRQADSCRSINRKHLHNSVHNCPVSEVTQATPIVSHRQEQETVPREYPCL